MKIAVKQLKTIIREAIENSFDTMKQSHTGMKVYVALGGWDYEGTQIIAVCKSHDTAVQACEQEADSYEFTKIEEYDVLD